MFKPSKWRGEKHKIKVVFKLQFHATQVPQLAKDTLTVSLIPVDVGKPSVRLEKSVIQDGTCRWENPVYETVKFIQEPKTGKINEKMYQFIVSTGSSKVSVLGDVSVNFADYFDAIKPSSGSLPLKAQNSGAILHFTIQRMHGAVDQSRDAEENGIATIEPQDKCLIRKLSDTETDENKNYNSSEGAFVDKTTAQTAEFNGNLVKCKSTDAISGSGSESSSGPYTPQEIGLRNNIARRASGSFLSTLNQSSTPQKPITSAIITKYLQHQRSNTDWSVGDGSVDDSTNSSDDNLMKDISVEKLKNDLVVLARQAEVSELELQTLRKQIVKESKRGQELSKEVIGLKEERDALKQECQQLKASHKRSSKAELENDNPYLLLREIRQELDHEKDLNANLRIQLQKTQESNSELLLAVQDLDEMLENKNREISHISTFGGTEKTKGRVSKQETDEDEEQKALESLIKEHCDAKESYLLEQKIIDLYSEIEVYRRDRDELEMQMEQLALDYEILKQENHEIVSKLEQNHLQEQLKAQYEGSDCSTSMNELETQVESLQDELKKREEDFSTSLITIGELESQCESLRDEVKKREQDFSTSMVTIGELKSRVEKLQDELEKQKADFSTSLVTVDELKSEVECLEKEMEERERAFEADLDSVMHAKVEQEKRAIRAEEALRKTRLINGSTAERLQEEFRRLSSQMTSTFDANEKLARKALMEASELRVQKGRLEDMLEKANEELACVKDQYEEKLREVSSQMDLAKKQAERAVLELEKTFENLEREKEERELHRELENEKLIVKDEIIKLAEANDNLRVEIEKLKASIADLELSVQKSDAEKRELEKRVSLATEEAGRLSEELNVTRSLKNEKDDTVRVLQSELAALTDEYKKSKHLLLESKTANQTLRQQISDLKGDLKKREEIIATTEQHNKDALALQERIKQLEEQIGLKEVALENLNSSFIEKEKDLQHTIDELERKTIELDNKVVENAEAPAESTHKDDSTSRSSTKSTRTLSLNKLLIATSHDGDHRAFDELLSEMALMKEKNENMKDELREMQERYSEISLKFAEVEGERQQLVMTVRNLKKS